MLLHLKNTDRCMCISSVRCAAMEFDAYIEKSDDIVVGTFLVGVVLLAPLMRLCLDSVMVVDPW